MAKRRTVSRPAERRGVGLHSGAPATVRVLPGPAEGGIRFVRTDLPGQPVIPADPAHIGREPRRTAIEVETPDGTASVHTVEHLLSAAAGLGVDTLRVEIDGPEMPGLDGSAAEFVALLDEAGPVALEADRPLLVVREPVECVAEDGRSRIRALPPEVPGLHLSYLLEYPPPIGRQTFAGSLDEAAYRELIAPARTFVMEAEAEALLAMGFGKGADTTNTLVVGESGVLENTLRFPDEFVRHKVLDLIGDLALGAVEIHARIEAERSGHDLNRALVRTLLGA
ncbi:MAG: UDP-3-O-acyl-N-acetylglucosamine deacetylase [Planctomycetota bacterium]